MLSDRKQVFAWAALAAAGFVAGLTPQTQAQGQLWIRQFGTSGNDAALVISADGAEGVMVAGFTEGNLGGMNAGRSDVFLARYDRAGDRLWIRQFGTSDYESARGLTPDGAGGMMIAGHTEGSLGGPNAGEKDAFLARYDGAGNRLWIIQFGTGLMDVAYALAPDGVGGAIVTGETQGSLGGPNAGGRDAFLARYDGAGNQLWIRQFGTSTDDLASALAPDGAGGVLVAGYTFGSLGGPNAVGADVFLARYDSAGNRLWIRQFGTNHNEFANALSHDSAGGVLVAGSTRGSLGGPNAGGEDAFLARYDGVGNQLWIRQFGTTRRDIAGALAPDGAGGVLVSGSTGGSLAGPLAGRSDAYLARYDDAGNQLWIRQFGTSGDDNAFDLAPNGAGGVLVSGYTGGSLAGPNAGRWDAFLARFTGAFPLGDLNCDGRFDGADIDPFFLALGDPMAYATQFPSCYPILGDMNANGRLDAADIDPFFACLGGGQCP